MKTTDELLDDAIGELSAAALQIIPSDDQIIADHVRNSVATLLRFKSAYRSERAVDRKAILEEAASMVERSYEGACYEGISRFIAADIRALNEAKP